MRHPRVLATALTLLSLALWAAAAGTVVMANQVVSTLPDRSVLQSITEMARTSVIYDASDRAAFTISKEQRMEVPLDRISPHLQQAVLAIEDQRFYEHGGVDVVRLAGALVANLREGRKAQGGSTITQQLARQSFLTPEKTYRRKLQEIVLATRIEAEYSKEQILELYLNKAYFGAGLYGAEAASLGYFGKPASDLSVSQAALLAGLVKAPSSYAPTVNPERALERRALVLRAMQDAGYIDEGELKAARAERLRLKDALRKDEPYGQYFKEMVRLELVDRFGREKAYEGGLKIYTTLDLDMQKAAEAAVGRSIAEIEKRRAPWAARKNRVQRASTGGAETPKEQLQAALVAMDPRTGHVRALVGGSDFVETKFNRATQALRQPGSAFKPFVYAAALEQGFSPAHVIDRLDVPIDTIEGAWSPEDGHSTASSLTMRAALKTSSNRAAVRMIEEVGVKRAAAQAERLGMGSLPEVPSLALGSGEVTLEALTAAYAVFANEGKRRRPVYIRRIEDVDGNVLFKAEEEEVEVVKPSTAYLMSTMLSDVINGGTAWKARQMGFRLQAAGKTGTTNDYFDAWFVGYTPSLVTGVWIGYDQPQTIIPDGYAGDVAVPLWTRFMTDATKGVKDAGFKRPSDVVGVNVCRLSGLRPDEGCSDVLVLDDDGFEESRSMVYTEYFVRGSEPSHTCPLHPGRSFMERVAGAFGGGGEREPVRASETGEVAPSAPAAAARTSPEPRAENAERAEVKKAEEPKKRGFWKRIFGIGKDDEPKKKRERDRREP